MGVRFKLIKVGGYCVHAGLRQGYRTSLLTCVRLAHDISVTPQDVLIDEEVLIKSSGFHPKETVTLFASVHNNQTKFAACGHYISDRNGVVDVSNHASIGGTYVGVEPMGVFWSMKAAPPHHEHTTFTQDVNTASSFSISVFPGHLRGGHHIGGTYVGGEPMGVFWSMKAAQPHHEHTTFTQDVNTASSFSISVFPGHLSLERLQTDDSLRSAASTTLQRRWMSNDVKRIPITDGNIRGTLFIPSGPGPHPGVLDISDCTGDLDESRAALLASKGYATLALAYWGHKDHFDISVERDFEYFMEAADWLSSHPSISDRLGVVGFSKGGQVSLLLAQHNPKVKAVVSISGAPFCTLEDLAWQRRPFKKGIPIDFSKVKEITNLCFVMRDYEPDWRNHLIEAWMGDAKCLCINGGDDHNLNPNYARYWYELIPEEKKQNFQMITYPGAGHMIETPYTPMCRVAFHKHFNFSVFMGGVMKPQAFAKQDSWKKILNFFEQNLKVS